MNTIYYEYYVAFRELSPTGLSQKWVQDITYVKTEFRSLSKQPSDLADGKVIG